MIRVLICDDQQVVREGLQAILSAAPSIEVVGLAQDGIEAVQRVAETKPDVVLMDLTMPRKDGVQATHAIRANFPDVRVLVLTTYVSDEWIFEAVRAGAAGYLLKDSSREQLVAAIEGTAAGKTFVDPNVAGRLFAHVSGVTSAPLSSELARLTERELEVLQLLGRGLTNASIAAQLQLTEGTVRNYVSSVLQKLEVTDRTQAALLAIRSGLLA